MEAFAIKNLNFAYPQGIEQRQLALRDVSLTVREGEFVTICGRSGSGKTTLLRQLKPALAAHGKRHGDILFFGEPLHEISERRQAAEIGMVLQNPDNQIVTDKVWHELAFGLESLGAATSVIRLRVAEMASFFGIQEWFGRNVATLSGGQKQLLNLASIMVMQPRVLLLDEPTSQLDPIAAADFLATVKKINEELGTTVIMTEQRLEDVLPLTDRVVVMDGGRVIVDAPPAQAGVRLKELEHDMFVAMPSPMQIFAGVPSELACPVTVKEGRAWLDQVLSGRPSVADAPSRSASSEPADRKAKAVIELKDVWFRYERDGVDVVKDLSLAVQAGEFFALVGGNGTGKSTTLNLISGLLRPYRGKVRLGGRDVFKLSAAERFHHNLGVLPQNPQSLFIKGTVEQDLAEALSDRDLTAEAVASAVRQVAELVEIDYLLSMHPYDLSGGEQQRVALAKILLLEPQILLLDEPTKGLDGYFKAKLAGILHRLQAAGATILMVSHDIEFCAQYVDRCGMFFDGRVVTAAPSHEFFCGNSFYTTAANRMSRQHFPTAVTVAEVVEACNRAFAKP